MDPIETLSRALEGARESRFAYNDWVAKGGFTVVVKVRPYTETWKVGVRTIEIMRVGPGYVKGVHPSTGKVVFLPFAAVEVER